MQKKLKDLDKIDIRELCPKEWTVEEIDDNLIRVHYETKGRGNSPKPVILPKKVEVDDFLLEGFGMYLGDGKQNDPGHLDFTSIDFDMVKFMIAFFEKKFGFYKENLYCQITHNDKKHNDIDRISKYLSIDKELFKSRFSARNKNHSVRIQIGSVIFTKIFHAIREIIKNQNFLDDKILRKAFLRGIFAAEGCIAYHHKEKYIVYMSFDLHYKEDLLSNLIQKCLNSEKIYYKVFKNTRDNSQLVRITNWQNYWKCHKIRLFDLCERKKKHFLECAGKCKFHVFVNDSLLDKLFKDTNQRQLSMKMGLNPSTMCNSMKQKCFTLENLVVIAKAQNISLSEIKENTLKIRVGNNTTIEDREFVEFVFNLKNYH